MYAVSGATKYSGRSWVPDTASLRWTRSGPYPSARFQRSSTGCGGSTVTTQSKRNTLVVGVQVAPLGLPSLA